MHDHDCNSYIDWLSDLCCFRQVVTNLSDVLTTQKEKMQAYARNYTNKEYVLANIESE